MIANMARTLRVTVELMVMDIQATDIEVDHILKRAGSEGQLLISERENDFRSWIII